MIKTRIKNRGFESTDFSVELHSGGIFFWRKNKISIVGGLQSSEFIANKKNSGRMATFGR